MKESAEMACRMNLHLYYVEDAPNGFFGDPQPFNCFDLERIEAAGITDAAYWYLAGDYEGSGQILFRLNGRWYEHNCSHCSCYGPTDEISARGLGEPTIKALMASCTEELQAHLRPCAHRLFAEGFE